MIMPWSHWCRLCSKDNGCEINLFDHKSEYDDENETENDADLYTIIIKYFPITIDENDDSIPKGICQDCLKFIQNLQLFSDRQVKVETMFTKLIDKLLSIEDIDFNDIRQQYGIIDESKILKCDQSTDTTDLRLSAVKTEPNEVRMYKEYHETGSNNNENEPLQEPFCFLIKTENTCDEEETVGNETDSPSATRTANLKKKRKLNAKEIKYIADDEEEESHHNNSEEDSHETDEYDSEEVDDDDDDCHKKERKFSKTKDASTGVNQQQLKPRDKDSNVKAEIKCELCEKVFTRKNSKRNHMERVHSQPQQCNYECSICDKKFTSSRGLKQHALVHLPRSEEMYSCPFCDKKFLKACNVNPHIRAKHGDEKNKSFICEDCGKRFSTNGGLKEHRCTHNNSMEVSDEINEYDYEEVEDDDDDDVDDDDCRKKDKKISKMNKTNDGVNQQQLKPRDKDSKVKAGFKCELCDKVLSRKNSKRMHMERVHSQPEKCSYECSICDKKFTSSRGLKQHALVHLPRSEEMLYSCPFCDKKFIKACNVNPHIRARHSEKNKSFICEDCGKIFSTNGGLKEHRYTHIEETPFECSRCPKKFKNASRLRLHEDTHNGTEYVCPDCGVKLNTRRTLYMHMVIHSDEKKHKCEFCGAQFRQSRTLKNHLLLHTGIKPYTCQFCDKTFTQGTSCRSHKKKVHAAELAALEKAGKECNPKPNIPKLEQLKAMAANSPFRMQPFRTPISTGSTIKTDLM